MKKSLRPVLSDWLCTQGLFLSLCLYLSVFTLACGGHSPKLSHQNQVETALFDDQEVTREKPYRAKRVLEYQQYNLLKKYRGEQALGVKYFSPKELERLRTSVKNGLLMNHKGQPLDPELDQISSANRTGKAIYVVSIDGLIWVCFDQRYGFIHHSSLLAGAPVLAAGELVLDQGQLLSISNSSGHYKPGIKSIDTALEIFKLNGVDLSQVERFDIGSTGLPLNKRLREPKIKRD